MRTPRISRSWRNRIGKSYIDELLSIAPDNLVGLWPLSELSGTRAYDVSYQKNHGTHTNVALGKEGIGDGGTSALYVAASSPRTNIYSAGMIADFNGAEGTIMLWGKVSAVGAWTDATGRYLLNLRVDSNNEVGIARPTTNNTLTYLYKSGGTNKPYALGGLSTTAFFMAMTSFSEAGDYRKAFFNGVLKDTATGLGTWAGNPASTTSVIGAYDTSATAPWSGHEALVGIWNTPFTTEQAAYAYSVLKESGRS